MSKRVTNDEVNSKIGSSLSPGNKCPTKGEILATGRCGVTGYAENQLVDIDSINRINITIRVYNGSRVTFGKLTGSLIINGIELFNVDPIQITSDNPYYAVFKTSSVVINARLASLIKIGGISFTNGTATPSVVNTTVTSNYYLNVEVNIR